jgi:hypothetical protein
MPLALRLSMNLIAVGNITDIAQVKTADAVWVLVSLVAVYVLFWITGYSE